MASTALARPASRRLRLARPLPPAHRLAVCAVFAQALAVWTATRLLDVALTLCSANRPGPLLWHWYFWDAGLYMSIARHGYAAAGPNRAGFFPLYPLLLRGAQLAAPGVDQLLRALLVTNLATLAALLAVGLLAAHEARSPKAALPPMLLLAASPLAVFLGGAYSDSLFLALAAGALLAARRGAWTWAALAATLATLARPFGLALVPALLIELAVRQAWWWRLRSRAFARPRRATVRRVALLLLLPAAALGAFMAVLWSQYGDPLAYPHAQARDFGHAFRWPWETLALAWQQLAAVTPYWSYPTAHMLLDLVPLLFCLGVLCACARRWPASFTVYTALGLLLCLTSPTVHAGGQYAVISGGRYCYALVPVLLQLGVWVRRWPRWCAAALLCASLGLQCALTVFELRGGWLV